jgi:N-acetylmuramoyl-L-alanine amidase
VIALLLALVSLAARVAPPAAIVVVTPRGDDVVPVVVEQGVPLLAAPRLAGPLGLSAALDGTTATVQLGGVAFTFELGSPYVRAGDSVYPLAAAAVLVRDTLFLPLQWLADPVPRAAPGRYRYSPRTARFEELAVVATAPAPPESTAARAPHPLTGLRGHYRIVVDPGHGGIDPGNPGLFLPRGVAEKHVALAIARQLRAELTRRGVDVALTRNTDTLIALGDRGPMCRARCDLFVSIHLNAMPPGRRQREPHGVEVYFLSEAKSEDQRRVAQMENDAIRFSLEDIPPDGAVGMIIRSLQENEYLRESARLATLVQAQIAAVHPGQDRGVQQAGLMVLSTAGRPAILVEAGFATNRADGEFLGSALGQRKIAHAIADGVVAYLQELERKLGPSGTGR